MYVCALLCVGVVASSFAWKFMEIKKQIWKKNSEKNSFQKLEALEKWRGFGKVRNLRIFAY